MENLHGKGYREINKFTDSAKLLSLIQIEFFQFLSKFCIYPCDKHSSKNNSGVSRSSYVLNKKISLHFFFSKLKLLFWQLKRKSITIKTNVKTSNLLPSILGQSTTSTTVGLQNDADLCERWCFITSFQISCSTKKNFAKNVTL